MHLMHFEPKQQMTMTTFFHNVATSAITPEIHAAAAAAADDDDDD
jgi:hypothetical protein